MVKLEADKKNETERLRKEVENEKIRQQENHRANIELMKRKHEEAIARTKADQEKNRLEYEKECVKLILNM